jgi:hypothetical protein
MIFRMGTTRECLGRGASTYYQPSLAVTQEEVILFKMNKSPKQLTYNGIGINGSSYIKAVLGSLDNTKAWTPAAATWPFVKLSLDNSSVTLAILRKQKTVMKNDVAVSMDKLGHIYFQTEDHANDFGFWTFSTQNLITQLQKFGYYLDGSCEKNMRFAKTTFVVAICIGISAIVLGAVVATSAL